MFEIAQEGSEFTKKIGSFHGLTWIDSELALSYVFMGEIEKAISIYKDMLTLAKRIKYAVAVSGTTLDLGYCYQFLGEWDKSLQYLTEARDAAKKIGEYQFFGTAAALLGELFMNMEDYAEAEKYLEESKSVYEKAAETSTLFTDVFPALSKLYLKKGETEKAKELIEKVYEHATRTKNRLVLPYVEMLKAMLLREQKKWGQSIEHFEKGLQGYKSLNAQKWYVYPLAGLLYEYGLTYLERNEEGDKEKAYLLLDQALKIFQKMGARKDIEKTKSKIKHAETGREIVEPEPVAEVSNVALPARITTGYNDLDNLLFGGIPRDYAVIVTSPSCDERDLLTRNFIEAGAKEGQITFYIVTSVTGGVKSLAEEFQSNFYLFVCNPQADKIIQDMPTVFKLKGVENLTGINIALSSAFRRLDNSVGSPRRICIEIVSDVLLQHHTVQTRKWLNALIPDLKSRGFTTLAVMDSEIHPQQEVRAIVGVFEGEINIYEKKTEEGPRKFLKIKKLTNQEYLDSELPLKKGKL
jgi:tetratricopeptide (TPR) repeat protein/KaiC/GvpD/RAD55 family RecA-like ATPase